MYIIIFLVETINPFQKLSFIKLQFLMYSYLSLEDKEFVEKILYTLICFLYSLALFNVRL